MSAPVRKCEVCDDTGSKSCELDGDLDCTVCTAAEERAGLRVSVNGPYRNPVDHLIWRAYQLGKAAAQPKEDIQRPTDYDIIMMACEIALQDDVWEIKDADLIPFVRRCIAAAAPVVPVAAQPVVAAWKPTAIADEVLEEAASIAIEMMGWDLDHDGEKQMQKFSCLLLASIAKLTTGTPQIAAPALEAQPAGEVVPAEKLCALLPGPYYMDLPDGGSVTVLEQVERMAKDAARYHWLCKTAFDSSMTQEEIDKEVDAAMAQGEKA